MTSERHIALDGPEHLNGRYIDAETAAANGYELIDWAENEKAYLHTASAAPVEDMEIPDDVLAQIEEAYDGRR